MALTQKDAHTATTQRKSHSAMQNLKLPQLNVKNSMLTRNWSTLQPYFGYVSVDHLIPYSFVVSFFCMGCDKFYNPCI